MNVTVLSEHGYSEALFGMGLSYGITSGETFDELISNPFQQWNQLDSVAHKLFNKDGGHNKFLESMMVWIDINAPRYWHQEFDTYRVGTTKQSESTIHTITKRHLTQDNFEEPILDSYLEYLNNLIDIGASKKEIKNALPEGFLQRRIVCTNYKTLRNICHQRKNHAIDLWNYFIKELKSQLDFPEFLE